MKQHSFFQSLPYKFINLIQLSTIRGMTCPESCKNKSRMSEMQIRKRKPPCYGLNVKMHFLGQSRWTYSAGKKHLRKNTTSSRVLFPFREEGKGTGEEKDYDF